MKKYYKEYKFKESKPVYIYSLTFANNEVFYIGQTTNIYFRQKRHVKTYDDVFNMEVIETLIDTTNKNNIEKYWIEQFRQWGFNLLNDKNNFSKRDYKNQFYNWELVLPDSLKWLKQEYNKGIKR